VATSDNRLLKEEILAPPKSYKESIKVCNIKNRIPITKSNA
jgi:hypothetical protein